MEEVWKDIKGLEGRYQVSNLGRIKSLPKEVRCQSNSVRHTTERILKPNYKYKNGAKWYLAIDLGRGNTYLIHRIVAEAFVDNPNNYPQVNHIDGNKWNCVASNLEWCTGSQNMQHAYKVGLQKPFMPVKRCRRITSISKSGDMCVWDSIADCSRALGIRSGAILRVISGERNHCHGYKFYRMEKYVKYRTREATT